MSEGSDQVIRKVILLYIADQMSGLTQDELMSIAIDTIYMDYFDFSVVYEDLIRDGFLLEVRHPDDPLKDASGQPAARVNISATGKEILTSLYGTVPLPVRNHLRQAIEARNRAETPTAKGPGKETAGKPGDTARSTVIPESGGRFLLSLQLMRENHLLVDLKVSFPDEASAAEAAAAWQSNYPSLYPRLLALLTGTAAGNLP